MLRHLVPGPRSDQPRSQHCTVDRNPMAAYGQSPCMGLGRQFNLLACLDNADGGSRACEKLWEWLPIGSRRSKRGPSENPVPLLTWTFWSGRPDLNRRPLDPQARIRCLMRSEGVGLRASHLRLRSAGVAVGRDESEWVGSRGWLLQSLGRLASWDFS